MRVYSLCLWEEWDLSVYFNHRVTESGVCFTKATMLESTLFGASPLWWQGCWQLWHRQGKEGSLMQPTDIAHSHSLHSHSLTPECSNLCFVSYTSTILNSVKALKRKHVYCIFFGDDSCPFGHILIYIIVFCLYVLPCDSVDFNISSYLFPNNTQLQHVEKARWC